MKFSSSSFLCDTAISKRLTWEKHNTQIEKHDGKPDFTNCWAGIYSDLIYQSFLVLYFVVFICCTYCTG